MRIAFISDIHGNFQAQEAVLSDIYFPYRNWWEKTVHMNRMENAMKKIKCIVEQIIFTEDQRFRQVWIWMFILLPVAISLYALISQTILGNQFGNSPMPDSMVILMVLLFGIALPLLFYFAELRVRITNEGIYVKFLPFHFSWLFFSLSEIGKFEKIQYRPLREYGGWGIRYGLHGKAYNVSGNMGIRLTFLNGKKLLIGSQKPDEFEDILHKIM